MPANDIDTTTVSEATTPAISLRTILVMAGQLAGEGESLLSDALAALDLGDETIDADQVVAQALTDLNAAIRQIRTFKQARSAGVEFDRPALFAIGGGQIRDLTDLFTLYGATTVDAFNRRVSDESDFRFRVTLVTSDDDLPGVRIEASPPSSEVVASRELLFPFSRAQFGSAIEAVETEVVDAMTAGADPDLVADTAGNGAGVA